MWIPVAGPDLLEWNQPSKNLRPVVAGNRLYRLIHSGIASIHLKTWFADQLREYPTGFGKRLLEAYHKACSEPPRQDLRRKFALDAKMTDKELFRDYPCNPDQRFDAKLPEVFWYLAGSRSLRIPDSWVNVMADFKKQLNQRCAPQLYI